MIRSRMPFLTVGSGGRWERRSVFVDGFVPVWLGQIAPQLGLSEAEQMLCSSGFNIAQLMVVGLITISGYFILKAIARALNRQVRGGLYSLIAGIVPLFIPAFLTLIGVDTACLFP